VSVSRPVRLAACAALAVSAGVVAWIRVAPLGPTLDIRVTRSFATESQDVYDLRIVARGGEVIDEVRVELLRGSVRVAPPGYTRHLGPGIRYLARVTVADNTPVAPAVRVIQKGRINRTYDVELGQGDR